MTKIMAAIAMMMMPIIMIMITMNSDDGDCDEDGSDQGVMTTIMATTMMETATTMLVTKPRRQNP